jgi:methionyl-tRNA formyltransferase
MKQTEKVLFIGSKKLGLRVLQEMYLLSPETLIGILTVDDTNDTRTALDGFQDFASANNLNLYIAKSRKQSEQIVMNLQPDLCIVVGWYWLISDATINCVPSGFVGLHNSLLPKYRGGSPLIWALINNEAEVGFSFFTFTSGMDDGPIWAQGSIFVDERDYISCVLKKFEDKAVEVFREKYLLMLDGSIRPLEQRHESATYCAQRFPDDGNIDWQNRARDVCSFIRAQSDPYPGAYTYLEGNKITIWKAKIFEFSYYGMPGQVARISSDGVYVICGDNRAIILEEVQVDGNRGKANYFITSIKGRMASWK